MRLLHVVDEFGKVIEYKRPNEPEYEVFRMTSRYYLCDVEEGTGELQLDPYEQALGFQPAWVDIDHAIMENQLVMKMAGTKIPGWIDRGTHILEHVKLRWSSPGGLVLK